MIETNIGKSTRDTISIRGMDLVDDLVGRRDFVEVAVLQMIGRFPSVEEGNVLNAILIVVSDHGLTPSALAARLTHFGSPESLQGAVAAGLLGAGNVILGAMQEVAEILSREVAARGLKSGDDMNEAARAIVERTRAAGVRMPGYGHPIHVDGDPRVPKLIAVATANGVAGVHLELANAIGDVLTERSAGPLPMNAAAAIGAITADMGLPAAMARGLALVGRTAGLVAHLMEEVQTPLARHIWAAADSSVVSRK